MRVASPPTIIIDLERVDGANGPRHNLSCVIRDGNRRARSRGTLVTFEGTEGAGKSTLIHHLVPLLRRLFRERGISRRLTVTREPGGSRVAEEIRGLILRHEMDPWCELFLYEAARAEHLARTVLPALHAGDLVLCDRFTDSSLAYQAFARGLPWERVDELNQIATHGNLPDLTVLVDVEPATGLKRAREKNRFEAEGLTFQAKVRRGFLKSMRQDPERWLWLKAKPALPPGRNAEKVAREILSRMGCPA